ncbi:MarR family transcriptional regulator [Microbacterium sp. NPDC055665]
MASPVPPSTPYCIDIADGEGRFWLAPFDLDAKQPEDFEQAVEDLGVVVRVLRDAGVPYVVCKSSPKPAGGFHVFVPLDGVELPVMEQLADAAKAVLPSLDHGLLRNAAKGAIRPPGAPHAAGGQSIVMEGDPNLLLSPTVTAGDLLRVIAGFRQLRPAVDPTTPVSMSSAADETAAIAAPVSLRTHRPLPAWGEAHMAAPGGGRDPSRNGYMCLLAAAVAGWTLRDVTHAAQAYPGMEYYRTKHNPSGGPRTPRSRKDTTSRLERQWAKAQERALLYRYAPADTGRDLTELTRMVDVFDGMLTAFRVSPGRWSRDERAFTDSTVMTGLAWLSLRSGKRDVAAALRTIADTTGLPSSSVHRSLKRLQKAGLVACTRESDGPDAAVWRVQDTFSTSPEHVGPHHNMTARPPGQVYDARAVLLAELEERVVAGRHDVFTRAGLGPTARRVYEALRAEDADVELVAERAGLPVGRGRAVLQRLRRYVLARTKAGLWRRPLRDQRARAAKQLGTDGVLARRARRHERERELWAWWQNHLTRKGGRSGKNRAGPGQTLIFQLTDTHGGPEAYPSYPTYPDGQGDHHTAWRYVVAGLLQQLRDTELAA